MAPWQACEPGQLRITPPLSLYVHFPWCIRKCPYCDFNSHKLNTKLDEDTYVKTLLKDLQNDLTKLPDSRQLESIFFGGGTPSLFSAKSLQTLLEGIAQIIECSQHVEITMEANPGSVEHDQFSAYRESGINRISLGVQSFDDAQLTILGRIHNGESARNAIQSIKDSGFDNFNLDIMYALPGQTLGQAIEDCNTAVNSKPSHLSFYQLTIEPNTLFHKHPPTIPDSDEQLEIQMAIQQVLACNDYHQYEVSAYAKRGFQCAHNLNYWRFGDYLGIGAGAHSKITMDQTIFRSWKQKQPEHYVRQVNQQQPYITTSSVADKDKVFELMLNGLRLKQGLDASTIKRNTGLEFQPIINQLSQAIDKGWVISTNDHIRCTDKGYLFIDEILQLLLPD